MNEKIEQQIKDKINSHPLTDEEKIKMFDAVQYYCVLYGVDLFTQKDADEFWQVLRYGKIK